MRIVILAESVYLRTSIRVNLVPAGHEIVEAGPDSLYQALQVLREVKPELAVVDLDLPAACCSETLVRAIREDPYLAPMGLIVTYAATDEEVLARIRHWQLMACLQKPSHAQEMASFLGKMRAKAGAQAGARRA